MSEDRYVINQLFCGFGQKWDSDYPIKQGGQFGDHVCIDLSNKSMPKLLERYDG